MSQNLRAALDSMYDAKIPEKWLKVSRVLKPPSSGRYHLDAQELIRFQGQLEVLSTAVGKTTVKSLLSQWSKSISLKVYLSEVIAKYS